MKTAIQFLEESGYSIQTIDCDSNSALAKSYNISNLPAYTNGKGETISGVRTVDELKKFYSE